MKKYSLEQIKQYLSSQDSLSDIHYNLNRIDDVLLTLNIDENIPSGIQCTKCHGDDGCIDICPYDEDINGIDTECDCCENCRQQCADDI